MAAAGDRDEALATIRRLRGDRPTAAQDIAIRRALWHAVRILRRDGLSVNATATELDLAWRTVRRLLDMPDPPDRPGKGLRLWWTPPFDGLTYAESAQRWGCDESPARRWASADEPPAPRGRPVRFTGEGNEAA